MKYETFVFPENSEATIWPAEPYKGLAFFQAVDRLLFSGRESDIDKCTPLLADQRTRILLLHGQTGCGKSSFLRAGLIPHLEHSTIKIQFLRRYQGPTDTTGRPMFIRSGADPIGRIAEALYVYAERPAVQTYIGGTKTKDLSPVRLGKPSIQEFVDECRRPWQLLKALHRLHECLSDTVIVVLDQAEEVITLADVGYQFRSQFFRFLKEFSTHNFPVKFLIALRKDYSGEFVELAQIGSSIPTSPASFAVARDPMVVSDLKMLLLPELDKAAVKRAIELPTTTTPLDGSGQAPFSQYRFCYAPKLVDRIVKELFEVTSSVLPVMQIVCRDLFERVKARNEPWVVDDDLYESGGCVSGPVDRHISKSLRSSFGTAITGDAAKAVEEIRGRQLLYQLVRQEADNSVHSRQFTLAEMKQLARDVQLVSPIEQVLNVLSTDDYLLLRTFSVLSAPIPDERKMYSLGHDFIGGVLQTWHREQEAADRTRARLVKSAWRFIAVGIGAALLAVVIGVLLVRAKRTGEDRRELDVLVRTALKNERHNPWAALSVAGQAVALAEKVARDPFEKLNPKATLLLARADAGLPSRWKPLADQRRGSGHLTAVLPKSGRFVHLDPRKVEVLTPEQTIAFSAVIPVEANVLDYAVGEDASNNILILQTGFGSAGLSKALYVLNPEGVLSARFDIEYFRRVRGLRSRLGAAHKHQNALFQSQDDLAIAGEGVAFYDYSGDIPHLYIFSYDNNKTAVPFKVNTTLDLTHLDGSLLFIGEHAVENSQRATSADILKKAKPSDLAKLVTIDVQKNSREEIELVKPETFSSCSVDLPPESCALRLLGAEVQGSLMLYAIVQPDESEGLANYGGGNAQTLFKMPDIETIRDLLVVDVATTKVEHVNFGDIRDQCLPRAPATAGQGKGPSHEPVSNVFIAGSSDLVILGFLIDNSVELAVVRRQSGGDIQCGGTLFLPSRVFSWVLERSNGSLLGAGPDMTAVWTDPGHVLSRLNELLAPRARESNQQHDARLIDLACKAGLNNAELKAASWDDLLPGVEAPAVSVCRKT